MPFIVRWPGVVEPGRESDHQLAFYDVMPTLCDIIGDSVANYVSPTKDVDYFDGITFLPELTGKGVQPEHDYLYWEFNETDQIGVREGDWKLIVKRGKPELYNLAEDIHEDNNIAAEHPEIVERLVEIARSQHTPNPHFSVTVP